MTNFFIDLTIVGIIAFCGWRGYNSGLIRGVFGVVAIVASLLLANIAATAYSAEFEGMISPFVGGVVETAISDSVEGDFESELAELEFDSGEFVTAYVALRHIGLPVSSAAILAQRSTEDRLVGFLADAVAERLSSALTFAAVFGIAFVLIAIVFAVVGNLIGFVFLLPGLRLLDIMAGVVFGLVKGFLIALALATVLRYFGLLASETIESTSVLNFLINNNPVANMLGI